MPTVPEYLATTTRAASLGYRVLIVAGSHVELLDAATGRAVGRVAGWADVGTWLETREQERQWKRAA